MTDYKFFFKFKNGFDPVNPPPKVYYWSGFSKLLKLAPNRGLDLTINKILVARLEDQETEIRIPKDFRNPTGA